VWADYLVQYDSGTVGDIFQGVELAPGAAQENQGTAFGQLGTHLQRQWWLDVFDERMPPLGSRRWRELLASLPMPPPDRGPALLLDDGGCVLLEDDTGGILRRA